MRDYLFRGKRKDDCEWLEGFALFADNKAFIFNNVKVEFLNGYNEYRMNFTLKEVIPETVGQYTGLTDKNGKKIFEGDIVSRYINWLGKRVNAVAKYDTTVASWLCESFDKDKEQVFLANLVSGNGTYVIGNIYDNPELLKGGEDND
ncbi:MAG: YopX family protein [Clostridiaceae bacterium]|nr:YopX family protein [Clostridiaceae bacterium]